MLYNGFDPGILALLAGEDRAVLRDEAEGSAPPLQTAEKGILLGLTATIFIVSAILLSGIAG